MILLQKLLLNSVSIFSCREISPLLKGHLGPPKTVGNKENGIIEIKNYHLGLKKTFQKIVVSTETGLKTKFGAVPTGTKKPPWRKLRCHYEHLTGWADSGLCLSHLMQQSLSAAIDCKSEIQPCFEAYSASQQPQWFYSDTATTSARLLQ